MITKPKDECRPHAPPCNKAARRCESRAMRPIFTLERDRLTIRGSRPNLLDHVNDRQANPRVGDP
jgi:hypothetical protein